MIVTLTSSSVSYTHLDVYKRQGLFWQYYEDLDKIKSSESYISITKELYKKIKTENGEELLKITAQTPLKVGDKVTVRTVSYTHLDVYKRQN